MKVRFLPGALCDPLIFLHIEKLCGTMNLMNRKTLREKVENLRKEGKTYQEIQKALCLTFSKSTLSYWCKNINLPKGYTDRIDAYNKFNLEKARKIALAIHQEKMIKYFKSVAKRNKYLEFS